MRSEERAGIISFLMLFLWGTLITEPFHIFARFIARAVQYACKGIGIKGIAFSLVLYLIVVSVVILMQKLEPTRLGNFIPCAISVVFISMLLVKTFLNRSIAISDAVSLAIPAAIALAFYILKFEKGLKWFTDTYTYSLAVALINSLIFVPISGFGGAASKFFYITKYNDLDITSAFAGLAGIPELVWGLFLAAFAILPMIYLATIGRRK
ncbi:hypothetical protein B0O40_2139 [Ruminococcaceae bacterium R-25]|nr:hypothetical protein B0O40_2139 [Ruminococcaceae bacterium R-25]SUQ21998.1 hypothetical protein SAMN06297423_2139 [Oscillospiraceae bacterium]